MKHLKKFKEYSSYQEYIDSNDAVLPNVSLVTDDNEVFFNPYVIKNNVITYQAASKLPETTSSSSSGFESTQSICKNPTLKEGVKWILCKVKIQRLNTLRKFLIIKI